MITAVRLALVEAPGRLVTALLGAASMAEAVDLVSRARRALPGLQAAEVLDDAGMALVREHLALAHPLAGAHPVYVLLETADDVEALAAAIGDSGDVAVADDTAQREALWRYREALNPAVNAAGVPHKLDVSVPIGAMAAFAAAAQAAVAALGGRAILWGHLGDGNLHVNVARARTGRRARRRGRARRWWPSTGARSARSTAWGWPSGASSASPAPRRRWRRWRP